MSKFKNYVDQYEIDKKKELVKLGEGNKPYGDILAYLENEIERSKQITSFNYKFKCFKEDGAYQLNKAVEEIYGVSKNKGDKTPSDEKPVQMIDVKLANGTRLKVPFGRIEIDELGKGAFITIAYNDDTNELYVDGQCQLRYRTIIDQIIDRTENLLSTESIYRFQAFELESSFKPKVINLKNIDKEHLILDEESEYKLEPLRARILQPEKCIAKKVPLKYGALLAGNYGTGKTLLAFKLAKQAIENKWTFIYLKDPTLLAKTLKMCKTLDRNGHGIIVFVEDVDQVTRGNRDSAMQDILNTLDGGDTKDMNVIALFTTNHIELIEPTFLRGKRIGSIITLKSLTAATAQEFLKYHFTKDGYELDDNMEAVCQYIGESDIAPAFMTEIIESIKTRLIFSDTNLVTEKDVRIAVDNYLEQVELSRKKDMSETPEMKLASSLKHVITNNLAENITTKVVDSVKDLITEVEEED